MKNIMKIVTMLLIAFMSLTAVHAFNDVSYTEEIDMTRIKINGNTYQSGQDIVVRLGERLNFDIEVNGRNETVRDVQIRVELRGYQFHRTNPVTDVTELFDVREGQTRYVPLSLTLPYDLDKRTYTLVVTAGNAYTSAPTKTFYVTVEGDSDALLIRDVVFSPGSTVVAGRSLTGQVLLENIGERRQETVRVRMAIPELSIEDSKFVDRIDAATLSRGDIGRGDRRVSEELFLRIPTCAPEGNYQVVTEVFFRDGREKITTTDTVAILESDLCEEHAPTQPTQQDRTVITAPAPQDVVVDGAASSFPIIIQNSGSQSKSYTVSVSGLNAWGTYQVSDPAPVVGAGQNAVVYVYVTASESAALGPKPFTITVASGTESKAIPVTANVVEGRQTDQASLQTFLQIGVLVLVALLIILGFIVIFTRLKDRDDEDDQKGQTYY